MKTAVATLTLLWAAMVWALPKKDLEPSQILLKNLPTEKLDSLMESRLQELQEDIVKSYETQLREHEDNIKLLRRHRRDATSHNKTLTTRSSYNPNIPNYWHSYTYDAEIGNREKLNILDIDVKDQLGNINIVKVFSLDLWNLSAIYQSESHVGYVLKGGRLQAVIVRNRWTKSLVGCPCEYEHLKQGCACCEEGACRCRSAADTCVQCGLDDDRNICDANRPRELELDAAVGFQYYLDYYDLVLGVQRVLVASRGTTVSFYKFNEDSAQPMQSETGLGSINFARPVTHLGYGETFKDFHGIIKKDRFLITFRAGESSQQFHGINIETTGLASGMSEVWQASGSEMKAWQSGGRVMLAVLDGLELFVHELKANQWHEYRMRNIQTLSLGEPILYWKSFCMGFENYLVVVTSKTARLYLHSGMHYQTVQNLSPSHGLSAFSAIVPVSIPKWRGKAVLLTGEGNRLLAYVWNGAKLLVELNSVKVLKVSISNWSIVYGHADMKLDSNLVFVTTEKGPMRLEVKARLEDLPDPVLLQNQELHKLINTLEGEFKRQSGVIDLAHDRLAHSIEGQHTIKANVVIDGGIAVNGTLDTWNLEANSIMLQQIDSSGRGTFQGYKDHLNSLGYYDSVLNTLNATLSNLHLKLNDAVPASGTSRLISGVKTLVGGGLRVSTLSTDHLTVRQTLDASGNLFPLDDILKGLVRHNDTRIITGRKTFLKTLKIGDLYAEYLDDIPVNDIVTTDGSHTIAGASFASGLQAETINVTPGGTVGGIDLSENAVLLSGEAVLGICKFKNDLSATDIVAVSRFVNGVDLDRLSSSVLTTSGGTVMGSLVFSSSLTLHTLHARYIMGVDTARFMSTTVFKHQASVMSGTLVVPSVVGIDGDLVVEGKINGKNFPKDYPLQTDSTINFGAKRFTNVSFDTLRVGPQCLVDGLSLHKLVTLHTPQTITGPKTFANGLYIRGDLDITSKIIDGVNLDDLNASLSYIGSSDWKFDVVFNKAVKAPSLSFGGRLNNLDWATFTSDIVYDDEKSVVIASKKNFKLGLAISNATFQNTFNGASFSNLVTLSSARNIDGKKVFTNDVSFGSLTVDFLDGIDLNKLANSAVYLNKEGQVVTGRKTFTSLLTTKALEVTGRIINLDLKNVVTKNTDQTFTAAQSFQSVVFSDLRATSIDLAAGYTINTIDIFNLNKSSVSLTSPSFHSSVLTVKGPVTMLGQLYVGTINGYDINMLINNLVMRDESSIITGDVTFRDLTVQGPIMTRNLAGANGFNISNINYNAVKVTGSNVMSGAVTWGPVILQRDVSVGGLVNGINLFKLSQDVVYKDVKTLQVITGKKIFEAGITVHGDIVATSVNGIDLTTRMLTRHTVQTISAPYTFFNVEARSTVSILGLYNNVNLTKLASEGRLGANDTIYGNVTFLGGVSVGNLRIHGTFNSVDVEKRMADCVLVRDAGTLITGKKTFLANMTTFRNLQVNNLNNVPLEFYLKHVVLKNVATTIDHKIVVQGSVTSPSLTADALTVQGTVDGVDYNTLLREAVYLHKNQTIDSTLVFMRDVTVHGDINTVHLNGMNLETDFLTTDTEQTIPYSVTFGNMTSGDVAVAGNVNSWYLPDEVAITMKEVGGQTVTGRLTIGGSLEVLRDVILSGLVGTEVKVDLSKQAVQLHRNTEIYGSLTFTSPVTASTLTCVPGIVNNLNIPELFRNAWYLDKATDITGSMIFEGPVLLMEALLRNSSLPSLKISDLQDTVKSTLAAFNRTKIELEGLYKSACPPVIRLYSHLERAIFEGDYFASVFEYVAPYQRHSSTSFMVLNQSFVLISWEGGRCDSALYKFMPETTSMVHVKTIVGTGYAHQWLFLGGTDERVFLAMAASARHNCTRRTSAIWSVTETTFEMQEELASGEHLSHISRSGGVMLFVHGSDGSDIYTLNLSNGVVKRITVLPGPVDFSVTLTTKLEIDVIFQSYQGNGVLIVRGSQGVPFEVAQKIDDGVLLEHHGRVYLLLAVTRVKMHREEYLLELYTVNLHANSLTWLDAHVMASRLQLTAFFAGVPTTGSYIIVALQESRVPVVYTLLGETLKEMGHLSTPRVSWAQHMAVVNHIISGILDHYLLLGQTDHTTVLASLVMKGAALPRRNLTCDYPTE